MKTIILPLLALFLCVVTTQAQTYFYDNFFGESIYNWTLIDADGDGENFGIISDEDVHLGMVSSSMDGLTPDNWMIISRAIDLQNASGTIYLSWSSFCFTVLGTDENYSVYVGTSNKIEDFLKTGPAFNLRKDDPTEKKYLQKIDVSSFKGKKIYVAFRHHDVEDDFFISIDQVKVFTVPQKQLVVKDFEVDETMKGDCEFSIRVVNEGLETVNKIGVKWFVDDKLVHQENLTDLTLEYGDAHLFEYPTNVKADELTVKVQLEVPNGFIAQDTYEEKFQFVSPIAPLRVKTDEGIEFDLYKRLSQGQVVVLDFMASWCGPCRTSTPALSEFIQKNKGGANGPIDAVAITVEESDDLKKLKSLNWHGGFYNYPKIPYDNEYSYENFNHYSYLLELNEDGSIPLFVMICPDKENPENSQIISYDTGYYQGMFENYQADYEECLQRIETVKMEK